MKSSVDLIQSLERRILLSAVTPLSGVVIIPGFADDYSDSFTSVKVTPDGKIVAVGSIQATPASLTQWTVFEFNADGSLNTSFGTNGQAPNPFSGASGATTVKIVNDLNDSGYAILVGGSDIVIDPHSPQKDDEDFALARYTSNGQLDTSFNGTGMVTRDLGSLHDNLISLLVNSDQTILASGTTRVGRLNEAVVVKLNADGTPYENTASPFGTNGVVIYSFDRGAAGAELAAVPDGAGPAGSFYLVGFGTSIVVARCQGSGALDPTFGSSVKAGNRNGFIKLAHLAGGTNALIGVDATDPAGLELALASSNPVGISKIAFDKLTNIGTPDTTFGRRSGQVIEPLHYSSRAAPHGAVFLDSSTIFTFGYTYLLNSRQKLTDLVYEQYKITGGAVRLDATFNSGHPIVQTVIGNTRFNAVTEEAGIDLAGQDVFLFAGDLNIAAKGTVKAHHILALYRIYENGQTEPTFVG